MRSFFVKKKSIELNFYHKLLIFNFTLKITDFSYKQIIVNINILIRGGHELKFFPEPEQKFFSGVGVEVGVKKFFRS
jgi:hypothetical protein